MTVERAARKSDAEIDWLTIEAKYRAGDSARALGREFDIPHTRIARRAKRFGWIQNPAGIHRERVKAALLGTPGTAAADELIDKAVAEDAEDMALGLSNARAILRRIGEQLKDGVPVVRLVTVTGHDEKTGAKTSREEVTTAKVDPNAKDLRTLGAANLAAVETVRRIKELDGPNVGGFFSKEERDAIVAAALDPS